MIHSVIVSHYIKKKYISFDSAHSTIYKYSSLMTPQVYQIVLIRKIALHVAQNRYRSQNIVLPFPTSQETQSHLHPKLWVVLLIKGILRPHSFRSHWEITRNPLYHILFPCCGVVALNICCRNFYFSKNKEYFELRTHCA